jgi:hypothetical protein
MKIMTSNFSIFLSLTLTHFLEANVINYTRNVSEKKKFIKKKTFRWWREAEGMERKS